MTTMIVPNTDHSLFLMLLHLDPATQTVREITSPILAWHLEPDQPPHPISLLGDLARAAWCVLEGDSPNGKGFVPGVTVYLDRAAAVQALTEQARALAEDGDQ
jgi:hypothetical protein